MRKYIKSLALIMFIAASALQISAQTAMKPIIMVVPDKSWCQHMNYVTAGVPDYRKAIGDDKMRGAMAAMGNIMAERGYPLASLEGALDQIDNENTLNTTLQSKGDGYIQEDDLSKLSRVANADIVLNLGMTEKAYGPRRMMEFLITAVDAGSNKVVFGKPGTSSGSNAPVNTLLEEAVMSFMDEFCSKLSIHFNDIENNGRECQVIFQVADDCPYNFESEVSVNGESGELGEFIDYWLSENTVKGAYSQNGKTRTRLAFNQVRVPLFGKAKAGGFGSSKGKMKSLNAESFIKTIEPDMKRLGMSVSTYPVGVGTVYVTLGGL